MCRRLANVTFNNNLFSREKCRMPEMHASLRRLYEVANAATGKDLTPKELADQLNESPQTVTNWAARGVSMAGALKGEAKYGAPAVFVLGSVGGIEPAWLHPETLIARLVSRASGSADEPVPERDNAASQSETSHRIYPNELDGGQFRGLSRDEIVSIYDKLDLPEKQLFERLLLAAGFKLQGVNVEVDQWEKKDESLAQPRQFNLEPGSAKSKPVKRASR
jgi:hypothetical protein